MKPNGNQIAKIIFGVSAVLLAGFIAFFVICSAAPWK